MTMDLRMVKTRYQIKKAFLTLREKLMPEKIKVKDICEVAMINKTTFYKHYNDSSELSNEIDDNAVDSVLSNFPERDRIFDDPQAYIVGLLHALEHESANLVHVFRGKQEVLCSKLESRLRETYNGMINDEEDKIRLSFAIGGFIRVVQDFLFTNKSYNVDSLKEITVNIINSLFEKKKAAQNHP